MLEADLLFAFQEKEITVPLIYDGAVISARGFLNENGASAEAGGFDVQLASTVLFVMKGAVPGLRQYAEFTVGTLGADSAIGGRTFTVMKWGPVDDGAIIGIALAESAAESLHFAADVETEQQIRSAAVASQLFTALVATIVAQRSAAGASQVFPAIITSRTRQRSAAMADNGIFFKYDNDDPAYSDWAAIGGTFTGPTGRTQFDQNGDLQTVGANVRRNTAYMRTSTGLWKKVWLLEGQSTNLLPWAAPTKAQLFGSGTDVTDDPAYDGVGGFAKWLRFGTSLIGTNNAYFAPSVQAGITYCISVVVEMEDGSQPVHSLGANAGDFSLLISSGSAANPGVMRLGASNRYLCWAVLTMGSSGSGATGVYRFSTQSGKAFRVTGFQLEPLLFPTSRIITTGSALSRGVEIPTAPWLSPLVASTLYLRCIDLGAAQTGSSRQIQIGPVTGGAALTLVHVPSSAFVHRLQYSDGATAVTSTTNTLVAAYGDDMEYREELHPDGSVLLALTANNSPEVLAPQTGPTSLPPTWGTPELHLNHRGGGVSAGFAGVTRIVGMRGVKPRSVVRAA